jgi:hypothetical protein
MTARDFRRLIASAGRPDAERAQRLQEASMRGRMAAWFLCSGMLGRYYDTLGVPRHGAA